MTRSVADLRVWQRIHVRLTALYGVAVLVVLGVMAGVFYTLATRSELDGYRRRLLTTAVGLASAVDSRRLSDPAYAAELGKRFERVTAEDKDVASIYVLVRTPDPNTFRFAADLTVRGRPAVVGSDYDASNVAVVREALEGPAAEEEPVPDAYGETLAGMAPVRDEQGNAVAALGIDVQASRIERMRRRILTTTALVFAAAFGLLGLAALLAARLVRKPLTRVIAGTGAVARGELDTRVGLASNDEFGVLGDHFNRMAEGLEEREHIRDTFGRYVSEDVARKVLSDRAATALGGEEREVTVLFSDLQGYSTLAEHLSPPQVVEMLNAYLGAMNVLIAEEGGCIIEFLGDAILAVFNAPNDLEGHPERAVRCALRMRERLAGLNAEWEAQGLRDVWRRSGIEQIRARVGVHVGPVVAGNLGSRIRMKYAVIGDTVNVAARLEALNKQLQTDLLVSGDVLARLPEAMAALAHDGGEHHVKGRGQSVRVYSL